jgi:hypothetical protein
MPSQPADNPLPNTTATPRSYMKPRDQRALNAADLHILTGTALYGREVAYNTIASPGDYSIADRPVFNRTHGDTVMYCVAYIDTEGQKHRRYIWEHYDSGVFVHPVREVLLEMTRKEPERLYEVAMELAPYWFVNSTQAIAVVLSEGGILHPRINRAGHHMAVLVRQWGESPDSWFGEMFAGGWNPGGVQAAYEGTHEQRNNS